MEANVRWCWVLLVAEYFRNPPEIVASIFLENMKRYGRRMAYGFAGHFAIFFFHNKK
jgi:hypothetical protein